MSIHTTELPAALADEAARAWQAILESAGDALASELNAALADRPEAGQLPRVLACSPFAAELLRRRPKLLLDLLSSGELQVGSSRVDLQACKLEYSIVSPK